MIQPFPISARVASHVSTCHVSPGHQPKQGKCTQRAFAFAVSIWFLPKWVSGPWLKWWEITIYWFLWNWRGKKGKKGKKGRQCILYYLLFRPPQDAQTALDITSKNTRLLPQENVWCFRNNSKAQTWTVLYPALMIIIPCGPMNWGIWSSFTWHPTVPNLCWLWFWCRTVLLKNKSWNPQNLLNTPSFPSTHAPWSQGANARYYHCFVDEDQMAWLKGHSAGQLLQNRLMTVPKIWLFLSCVCVCVCTHSVHAQARVPRMFRSWVSLSKVSIFEHQCAPGADTSWRLAN